VCDVIVDAGRRWGWWHARICTRSFASGSAARHQEAETRTIARPSRRALPLAAKPVACASGNLDLEDPRRALDAL
jgi:hypothetical protein